MLLMIPVIDLNVRKTQQRTIHFQGIRSDNWLTNDLQQRKDSIRNSSFEKIQVIKKISSIL